MNYDLRTTIFFHRRENSSIIKYKYTGSVILKQNCTVISKQNGDIVGAQLTHTILNKRLYNSCTLNLTTGDNSLIWGLGTQLVCV